MKLSDIPGLPEDPQEATALVFEARDNVRAGLKAGGQVPGFVGDVGTMMLVLDAALLHLGLRTLVDELRAELDAKEKTDGKA